MTGLPEKYRTGEPAGGEKGSRSPELGADGTGSPSAAARAAEFISQRGSLPSTSSSAPLLSHPRSDAHSRGGRPARVGVTRASGQPLAAASLAGVGRGLMSGKGSARRAWSGTTKQAARAIGGPPGRCCRRRLACVAVTGRRLSSEAKANRAVTRTCSGWVRYTDDTWLV